MVFLARLDSFSDEVIQKYNGKHVRIFNSSDIFCSMKGVVVTFRSSSVYASEMLKFKKVLHKAGVATIRYLNISNLIVSLNLRGLTFENKNSFIQLLSFLKGSTFVLEFDSLAHFFYFESKILCRLEKNYKFELVLLKMNNQYLLMDTDEYRDIRKTFISADNNLLRILVLFHFHYF